MPDVNLSLSKEVVQPTIEAKIQAAVLDALGGGDTGRIMEDVMKQALMVMVDRSGKRSHYPSKNKYTLIHAVCMKAIEEATRQALAEWLDENKAQIKASFRKVLGKSPDKMVRAFVAGVTEAAASKWSMTVKVALPTDE